MLDILDYIQLYSSMVILRYQSDGIILSNCCVCVRV